MCALFTQLRSVHYPQNSIRLALSVVFTAPPLARFIVPLYGIGTLGIFRGLSDGGDRMKGDTRWRRLLRASHPTGPHSLPTSAFLRHHLPCHSTVCSALSLTCTCLSCHIDTSSLLMRSTHAVVVIEVWACSSPQVNPAPTVLPIWSGHEIHVVKSRTVPGICYIGVTLLAPHVKLCCWKFPETSSKS